MISAIGNIFRDSAIGRAAAAATVALPLLASFGPSAMAGEQTAAAPATTQSGKPVTLRVGPGFSLSAADGLAGILEREGCPTTVTSERGLPKRIGVEVGEKKFRFKESGSAGATALSWCLDKS